jgi:hypothetical protein
MLSVSIAAMTWAGSVQSQQSLPGKSINLSVGAEIIANFRAAGETIAGSSATITGQGADPPSASSDIQINDPKLDHIQDFAVPLTPWELSTQSETSIAYVGRDIVTGYISSAGVFRNAGNTGFSQLFYTGYSVSHDAGKTWTSGFIPSPVGGLCTGGDPSVGVDRKGNFYFAYLACDASANTVIAVSKSTDRGQTFGPSTIVFTSNGGDKEWLAIGPDPTVKSQDNLYVAWVNFLPASSRLMLSKSLDGGATWSTSTVFAPVDNGVESSFLQFPNPVVDKSNGRLYIPFLHGGHADADFIQVLVSDDAGQTFHFLNFNIPGVADPTAYPVVTPGTANDCGIIPGTSPPRANISLVLHEGPNQGGGQFGFPRFKYATRLITQPAAVVLGNHLLIAFNSSTSAILGDPNSGSEIHVIASNDGGMTWSAPLTVAASTPTDLHHVLPSITMHPSGRKAFVGYYVQQSPSNTQMGKLRTDLTEVKLSGGKDQQWVLGGTTGLSTTSFDLAPTNIETNALHITLNYDRAFVPCYSIGEYMSVMRYKNGVIGAWGDDRNLWTPPSDSLDTSIHPQADVFFRFVTGEDKHEDEGGDEVAERD